MYYPSTYVLLLNVNINDGHPLDVDPCALKVIGEH